MIDGQSRPGAGVAAPLRRSSAPRAREQELLENAVATGQRLNLVRVIRPLAAALSGGQKRLLERHPAKSATWQGDALTAKNLRRRPRPSLPRIPTSSRPSRSRRAMADHVASEGRDPLPFAISKIKPLPLHALNQAYVLAIIARYRLTDGGVR